MGNRGVRQLIINSKEEELRTLFTMFKKYEGGEALVVETFRSTLQDLGADIYKEKEVTGKLTNTALSNISVAIIQVRSNNLDNNCCVDLLYEYLILFFP